MNERVVPELPKGLDQGPTARSPSPSPAAARKSGKYWLIVGLVALLTAAAMIGGWWLLGTNGTVQYTTAPVTRGPVTRTVTATGIVNPELTIIVGTYVSGVIQELHCDYNTQVKKGQVCAQIDPRPYQTVVDQAKANLAVAKAQLEKDKASLDYAKSRLRPRGASWFRPTRSRRTPSTARRAPTSRRRRRSRSTRPRSSSGKPCSMPRRSISITPTSSRRSTARSSRATSRSARPSPRASRRRRCF